MRGLLLSLALGLLVLAPVHAQEDRALSDNGRFTMTPASNGFLRLDTRTGSVSLCTVVNGAAECRMAADDRAALLDEIDRLRKEAASTARRAPADRPYLDQGFTYLEQLLAWMKSVIQGDKQ